MDLSLTTKKRRNTLSLAMCAIFLLMVTGCTIDETLLTDITYYALEVALTAMESSV